MQKTLVEELGLVASAAVESEDAEMIVEDAESIEDAQVPEESNAEFDYVSETISKFTAGVRSVEFSSPELVDVSKVEAETTVGQIKENRGLNIQYADDLTEEQIAKINGSTVRAGDWALISVRPFISAETLTVTMKNGEVFTVQVTDAQITTEYLSDKGNLYEVTVYYDEEAGIPADAKLKVTHYAESSKEYRQVRDTVLEQAETDQMAELLALDISILGADGQEIEPATPVRVEMVIKNLKDELKFSGDSLSILHLDRSTGDVRVETVADAGDMANIHLNKETATAAFTLDSFSQFAITYGNYVKVNVHYVDVQGNELPGRTTGVNVSVGNTLTLSNYASQIQQPDNYTYLGAHYDSLGGQTITSLEAINGPDGGLLNSNVRALLFYDGSTIVARQEYGGSLRQVDVYLVYAPSANYYILDTIDEDGCLRVQNGTEMLQTGIDQNLFVRWYRSSNNTTGYEAVTQSKMLNGVYNVPDLDGPRVNVAIDEGADQYYKAEIYTVENNEERRIAWTEPYHVPYYDDVRNGGFETPHNNGRTDESVNRWPSNWQVENGQNGVIWKTTGTANDGTKRDIEIPQGANANGQAPIRPRRRKSRMEAGK